MAAYPRHWEADVVLSDGGTAALRPMRDDDADRLRAFHARLSPETVYNRFFSFRPRLSDADVARFTQVDHDNRVALVAELHGEIIGVVRYDRAPGTAEAEVAFVVEDDHQGRGLGAVLLEHLAVAARERGIERFTADTLPTNRPMLGVFRTAGYELARQLADGYVTLAFSIEPTGASLEVMRAREHRAEARSVQRLLAPRSVAVVGASREAGAPGHEVLRSLLRGAFEGPVFPVNNAAAHVSGVRAYADVRDVPDDVDLAVLAVPAAEVAEVVRACADKRVRGLVVVAGGFSDAGPAGRERLDELVRLVRSAGMRLIGPNAMGVVNTDPAVRLSATFAAAPATLPGRVGVLSQSGALAGTFLTEAHRRGLGLSAFVSIGDRADVSGNDLMQYWQDDPRTEVVLLHLQGFGNPRKFARIARTLSRSIPVVALKSGHAMGEPVIDALFGSAGVVRVGSLAQLYESAQLFALQPLPAGARVAVIGNSTALASMAADACRAGGLAVPTLSEPAQQQLATRTGTTQTANPVDLGPFAGAPELSAGLSAVLGCGEVDAVLAVVVPPPDSRATDATERLGAALLAASGGPLPLLACYLGLDGVPLPLARLDEHGAPSRGSVPSYASPESAALALARSARYAAWRRAPVGTVPVLEDIDAAAARAALAGHARDGAWLAQGDGAAVLAAFGIGLQTARSVASADEAVEVAAGLGYPVAVKAAGEQWRRRIDVGAVQLGLDNEAEVRHAFAAVQELVGDGPVLVQAMAEPGVSTVVRLVQDPSAGALLSLRLGGVATDLLVDPVVRTLPLTDLDAATLVRSIRGAQLLTGEAGGAPADVVALESLLLRVARLADELPEVAELVLDPVLVQRAGVVPLHAGVRLLPPGADPDRGARRLGGSYAVL